MRRSFIQPTILPLVILCGSLHACKDDPVATSGDIAAADQGYTVHAGGYVTSGSWHGYAWTGVYGDGSTISPDDFSAVDDGDTLCVSGSIAPTDDFTGTAVLAVNIHQAEEEDAAEQEVAPTGKGIVVDVTNKGESDLRIQIQAAGGDTDADKRWCASIEDEVSFVPWSSYNTKCWDGSGADYDGEPITTVMILVPGDDTDEVPFELCLNELVESDGDEPEDTGGASDKGAPGTMCESDADCQSGMRCLNSALAGPTRFCSPPCSVMEDCDPMDANTYGIGLTEELAGQNLWNTDLLWRGITCDVLTESPDVGEDDGNSWCFFICPDNSAAVLDDNGDVTSCNCLPNYSRTELSDGAISCEWDDETQCSIFKPCVYDESADEDVCSGELECIVDDDLQGVCTDLMTGDEIEACVQECSANSCDSLCLSGCVGNPGDCVDSCCDWSC